MATKKNGVHRPPIGGCKGAGCEWNGRTVKGKPVIRCEDGNGGCARADLLEANDSDFYDASLLAATRKINRILAGIPKDSRGRELAFLQTNMGTLLAWVEHGGPAGSGRVTLKDNDATVAKALNLKV